MNRDELLHHGIKGQRWGVRRFQNEDGTLTSAGKKRYDDDSPNNNNLSVNTDTKKKMRTAALIAGGTALTVSAAAILTKKHNAQVDTILKNVQNAPPQEIYG